MVSASRKARTGPRLRSSRAPVESSPRRLKSSLRNSRPRSGMRSGPWAEPAWRVSPARTARSPARDRSGAKLRRRNLRKRGAATWPGVRRLRNLWTFSLLCVQSPSARAETRPRLRVSSRDKSDRATPLWGPFRSQRPKTAQIQKNASASRSRAGLSEAKRQSP